MNFKEVYEKSLADAQKEYIESSNFSSKPIMTSGVLQVDSFYIRKKRNINKGNI